MNNDGFRSQGMDYFIVEKAHQTAYEFFKDRRRKLNGGPYLTHLFATFMILEDNLKRESEVSDRQNILAACWLQKILEYCPQYSYKMLAKDFNEVIAKIVKETSDHAIESLENQNDYEEQWLRRKIIFLEEFPSKSYAAQLILISKHIHNIQSLIRDYNDQGDAIWSKLGISKITRLCYYEEFFKVLTMHFHNPINSEYFFAFQEAEKFFKFKRSSAYWQSLVASLEEE